ncbi:MAG TPA: hypothetical protein VHN55_07635 [Sphingomicrobium sp.]|nr:hypothetical protein [Sphingomicrobium sp.]
MNPLWSYFWPLFALGLLLGGLAGSIWLRRKRRLALLVGAAVALAGSALWHGPVGAADRFAATVDRSAQRTLTDFEMSQIEAHLRRGPLSRRLILSGPADDFQRTELVRIMSATPGVSRATWSTGAGLPLLAEAALASASGFLLGLLLAYLVELHRRHNAQWKW